MKRFMSFLILATVLLVAGCSEYDDSELRSRIEKVEQELSRAKSDIEALKTLVDIVQKNQEGLSAKVYVTKVEAFSEDGASGWIVYFTSGDPIKIYNGAEGKNGKDAAAIVGKAVAERAIAKGINEVAFDRGGYLYHGRVKSLADGAREGGLKF